MLTEPDQSMIFVCCDCISYTAENFSIFSVPRNKSTVYRCKSCGKELIRITTSFSKYVIYVFCPICEEYHRYTMTKQELFNRNFFTLKCPQAGCNILFVGKDPKKVYVEYEKNNPFYDGLLPLSVNADMEEYDLIMDFLSILTDYIKNDRVDCVCGGKHISLRYEDNSVKLVCLDCGRTKTYGLTQECFDRLETEAWVKIK